MDIVTLFENLRIGIAVAYIALVMWRVTGQGDEWWPYVLGLTILTSSARAIERAVFDARVRRYVAHFAVLDPAEARAKINRMWLGTHRSELSQLLEEEDAVEQTEFVERFPFTRSASRQASARFWVFIVVAAASLASLAIVSRMAAWIGWACWLSTTAFLAAAGQARQSSRELESVLEVSKFGLSEIRTNGDRRMRIWTRPLFFVNYPGKHRIELSDKAGKMIPIDYRRLGFARVVRLIVELGNFRRGNSEDDSPHDAAL